MVSAHASVGSTKPATKHNVTTMNAGKGLDATKMVIGAMTMQCLTATVSFVNIT